MLGQEGTNTTVLTDDSREESSSLRVVPTPGTVAPEVPGVSQQLSPGLGVLGRSEVTRGDLLSSKDLEPRLDLDQALLGEVLTDRVTPRNIILQSLSLSRIDCLHAGMVEESLHGIHSQATAIARRKVQEGPVGGLYSKCVLQVR